VPQQPVCNYGFTLKAMDGISLSVKLVYVNLTSLAFTACKELSLHTVSPITKTFAKYDLLEISYHLYSKTIDLFFCADPGWGEEQIF